MTRLEGAAARQWGAALRDVLFPRGCAGCGMPDETLCGRCRALLQRPASFPLPSALLGAGFAAARYEGRIREAILGWKDHGDEECDGPFGDALSSLAAGTVPCQPPAPLASMCRRFDVVAVVPAPSSPSSERARGRRHVVPLARSVAAALQSRGIRAQAVALLRHEQPRRRAVAGKSVEEASVRQRAGRIAHAVTAQPARGFLAEVGEGATAAAVIVDDIVTTGATMGACAQALAGEGLPAISALCLAATPRQ